jgi:hypothetical protein
VNPVPIPDRIAENWYPGMRRVVVSAPSGRLDTDGSSPTEAAPLEAMFGYEDDASGDWPVFIEHWKPGEEELAVLNGGGVVRVWLYTKQLPVHAIGVIDAN